MAPRERITCELIVTSACNMECAYCIARELPPTAMNREVARKAVDLFLELGSGATYVDFVFTGGEPLLEFSLVNSLTAYALRASASANVRPSFIVKTNGTILNERIVDYFLENDVRVVVSIDGDQQTHDAIRKTKEKGNTHSLVSSNLAALLQNKIPCSASMTVHPKECSRIMENVKYLQNLGVRKVEIGPAYGTVSWTESATKAWTASVLRVARYLKNEKGSTSRMEITLLDRDSEHIDGLLQDQWGCNAALSNLAFLPDGQVSGCSALAMLVSRMPSLAIGNVTTGIDDRALQGLFEITQAGLQQRLSCRSCEAARNCTGGCLAINLSENQTAFSAPPFYCQTMEVLPTALATVWRE